MKDPQDTIQNLNRQYFDAIINPIEMIYVDMEMLQDFRLGALMTSITVKEEMAYIYSQIPKYNERLDLETAKYFPVLKKTDEELEEIIQKHPLMIAGMAPWTVIYNNFNAVLSFLNVSNKTTSSDRKPLTVVMNCADIDYPIELFDQLARTLNSVHGNVQFKLSHKARYEEDAEFYNQFNMFFMYDHEAFLNQEKLLDAYTTRDKFMNKIIYTLPIVNSSLNIDESEYAKALASTQSMLNLFCDFFYMRGGIALPNQKKQESKE